jgi:hypothetical protein
MKKPSWSFNVRDTQEIIIQRILNETPADEPWVVITDKRGDFVALFIRKEFLMRFGYGDDIVVCGEPLHLLWGSDNVPVFEQSSGRIYAPCCHCERYEGLKGWRASPVNFIGEDGKQVKISSQDIDALRVAQGFIRRIPVRVYVASDC